MARSLLVLVLENTSAESEAGEILTCTRNAYKKVNAKMLLFNHSTYLITGNIKMFTSPPSTKRLLLQPMCVSASESRVYTKSLKTASSCQPSTQRTNNSSSLPSTLLYQGSQGLTLGGSRRVGAHSESKCIQIRTSMYICPAAVQQLCYLQQQ